MLSRRTIITGLLFILVWSLPIMAFLQPNTPDSATLSYHLDWDLGDANITDEGWQVSNNLGYQITVTEGYTVAYEAQLNACEHRHGWFSWLDIASVYAGHGDDSNDSTLALSTVENIANPQAQTWGTVTLYEPTYCEAFFLVARGASDTLNQDDTRDMFGTSIYIAGTYIAPNTDEAIAFTLETQHANGTVQAFTENDEQVHIALSNEPMVISIVRSLDTLFNDVDFVNDNPDDASFQVLRNILNHTSFEVLAGTTHKE